MFDGKVPVDRDLGHADRCVRRRDPAFT
jgi:hypothetical protein